MERRGGTSPLSVYALLFLHFLHLRLSFLLALYSFNLLILLLDASWLAGYGFSHTRRILIFKASFPHSTLHYVVGVKGGGRMRAGLKERKTETGVCGVVCYKVGSQSSLITTLPAAFQC